MNRIIHFEIQAAEPERATRFYAAVFAWDIKELVVPGVKMKDENRYWLVTTGPENESGVNGGILFRQGPLPVDGQPVNSFVCTVGVANLNKSVATAVKAGGSVTMPRMPVRGVGWLAYLKDTEGNTFGMMQEDKAAQ